MTTVGCAAKTVVVAYVLWPLCIFSANECTFSCTLSFNLPMKISWAWPFFKLRAAAAELTVGGWMVSGRPLGGQHGWMQCRVQCSAVRCRHAGHVQRQGVQMQEAGAEGVECMCLVADRVHCSV
jgi:hypothetical protein